MTITAFAYASAQCVSTDLMAPKTVVNNSSIGLRAWGGTGNVISSDNTYASVTALIIGDKTHYLHCTNFNFNIPSTASICGIEVRIERGAGGLLANVRDNSIRIIKGGTITGTEHAVTGSSWPASDGTGTYGSSSDNWGLTWTPADINSSDFGIAISANLGGLSVLPSARIDHVTIRVWYNNILPVELTRFEPICKNETISLLWETASETQNDHFAIQHSLDAINFSTVKNIPGHGTTNVFHTYQYSHIPSEKINLHYYRLVQYDYNGDSVILDTKAVECNHQAQVFNVYPLQDGQLRVKLHGFKKDVQLYLIDLSGRILYNYTVNCDEKNQEVLLDNLPFLEPGWYLVTAFSEEKPFSQKIMISR